MMHLQGARLLLFVLTSTALTACSAGGLRTPTDSPFAPPPVAGETGEDPLIVGYRLAAAGEPELALTSFRRAAAEQGLTTEIISAIGSANLDLGRLGQAEALLRRATSADDATPQDWNNLGVILMERGETAEATQVFRKAFALDNGKSTHIRQNLTIALANLENAEYDPSQDDDYKVVRKGSNTFQIQKTP